MGFKKQITKFGSLQPVYKVHGVLIAEIARFEKKGRDHKHDRWETCYVTNGTGIIMVEGKPRPVTPGDVLKIAPQNDHHMIPTSKEGEDVFEMLLVYSENS